jgi:hypothetical protein
VCIQELHGNLEHVKFMSLASVYHGYVFVFEQDHGYVMCAYPNILVSRCILCTIVKGGIVFRSFTNPPKGMSCTIVVLTFPRKYARFFRACIKLGTFALFTFELDPQSACIHRRWS